MQFRIRCAAFAAIAFTLATVPAALHGQQKNDPCASQGGEQTANSIDKAADTTSKTTIAVLNDSTNTNEALKKFKTSIFGSGKKTTTPAPAAAPASSNQALLAGLGGAGGSKAPAAAAKPCPATATASGNAPGNKLVEAKQTTTPPATTGTTGTATPPVAAKATVQDEGDGKHVVLSVPGQEDAKELTIIPNTKNMYLEESTGDKYLISPEGAVTRIPHKPAAAKAS